MIFKNIDDKSKQIQTLNGLLSRSTSDAQKKLIDIDLKKMINGDEAEKENAYYLDFEIRNSENLILLHDVRIEHNGRTAQVDHILISRAGVELLETKSFKGELTINADGSLVNKNGKYTNTYPNPLEQSRRHEIVIRDFLESKIEVSKRIEMLGGIAISSKVLIHPKTNVSNSSLPDGFERGDTFLTNRMKEMNMTTGLFKTLGLISKMFDIEKVKEIAQALVSAHVAVNFDYEKKYRISKPSEETERKTPDSKNEEIKEKHESVAPIDDQVKDNTKKCPRCEEGVLMLRQVKAKKAKEKYEHSEFLGCNRYPKCKYVENF